MNVISRDRKIQIISCLCEGMSIRATARITNSSINTIVKLLIAAGTACQTYHDENVKGLTCKRVECDEIWAFCYAKAKNAPEEMKAAGLAGDVWTWTALDADSKLIVSWLVGGRDADYAQAFMDDVASRIKTQIQLTTDGHKAYLEAVENAFGGRADYAQLIKTYGAAPEGKTVRYSPAECTGIRKEVIAGHPDLDKISTSYVERQNLTMRMGMRRFTRLTNAFSKKIENHAHAVALYFMHYNFVRIHQTTRVTPAMEAGLSKNLWTVGDLVDLISK